VASRGLRAWLPWLLCAVSLVLLSAGVVLESVDGSASRRPWGWLEMGLVGLAAAATPLVGAIIASRLPRNPYGWLWCGMGLAVSLLGAAEAVTAAVGWPPWIAAFVSNYSFVVLLPMLVLAILLFPTGRVPGRRWRWLVRAVVAAPIPLMLVGTFAADPDRPANNSPWALQGDAGRQLYLAVNGWAVGMFVLGLPAVWALLLRYRSAGPVQRQQLTWFLYAAVNATVLLVLGRLGLLPWRLLSVVLFTVSLALFPAAVLVAMLRYRLYDLDRIVSRTVTYGVLTATIVVVYVVVVGLLSQLGLPGGSSDVVVAAVTLTVAGVAGPVRRRLQAVVDRRFDRARYDAGRAVDAFAARLRDQVDLDEIAAGLRDTVDGTVAPVRVGVWLTRPAGRETG
jgi:hypothetical protein